MVLHILHIIMPLTSKIWPSRFLNSEALKWFANVAKQAVDIRKQTCEKREDIMNYFLELESKKNLSIDETTGNLFTVFVDGFETTSFFLSSVITSLTKNQEIQNRLREEILSIGEVTDYEQIDQLPYLDKVLHGN